MQADSLHAGLASISARMDDTPHARGALAFCRAAADKREAQARVAAVPDRALVDHAALAIAEAYRSQDTRAIVFRQWGVEVVR